MAHNGPQQHLLWVCIWICLRPQTDRESLWCWINAVIYSVNERAFTISWVMHDPLLSQQHYSEHSVWETTLSGFGLGVCLKRLASNGICFMYDHVKSNSPMTVSHVKNNPWFNALVLALRFLSHIPICYTHTHTHIRN